jgi:hypothetical protein
MAKGQVSEEELTKGLKGIGNFGGLSAPRVRRDNPFRDSRAETPPPEPVKTIEVLPAVAEERVSKAGNTAVPKLEPKAVRRVPASPKAIEKEGGEKGNSEEAGVRKADVFTERVTLQISPEMRDSVEKIARELQRAKTSKAERITSNSVMRAAILLVTKHFSLKAGQAPNTEEELYTVLEDVLSGRLSAGRVSNAGTLPGDP